MGREHYFKISIVSRKRGEEQGSKSPFSLLSEQISPSSLNVYLTFSPSSLLFPPISPSSQLFFGPFLPPPYSVPPPRVLCGWRCSNSSFNACAENSIPFFNFNVSRFIRFCMYFKDWSLRESQKDRPKDLWKGKSSDCTIIRNKMVLFRVNWTWALILHHFTGPSCTKGGQHHAMDKSLCG